jgi:hypothetical protein
MRKLRIALIAILIAPALNGCLAIGAAALVTDVAVGTVGTVLETTVNVGGAAIDAVTPGDDDKDDDDDR